MKIITKEEILARHDLVESLDIVRKISKDQEGYMCHEYVHILYVLKEMMGNSCNNYLEIGTHNAGSIMTVMQSKYKTSFFGLDLWNRQSDMVIADSNINKNNKHNHSYELIKGDSMKDDVFNRVKKRCPQIDFLFIDGGHMYNNVINDFERYAKLVTKNGIIVFDDYLYMERTNHGFSPAAVARKIQVRKAVDYLMKKHGHAFNIIGTIPNNVGAQPEGVRWDDNLSYIIQNISYE